MSYQPPKLPPATRPIKEQREGDSLIGAGYVLAVLIPIIGAIFGLVLLTKERVGPGLGVLVVSIIMGLVWIALLG